jgi:hypothetical protein
MSSTNTIFPEKFLSDYHKMSEEDQLKLALTGYLMKISLNNPENTIFKRGDD